MHLLPSQLMARRCANQPANAPKANDKPPQLNANDCLLANHDMDLLDEFPSIHEPDDCKQHNFSHYMGVEDENLLLTPTLPFYQCPKSQRYLAQKSH